MRRIIFVSPFSRSDITGGIKTVYRHAELLTQSGLDACIWQPEGKPQWLDSTARILSEPRISPSANDVLVFPETLNGVLAELAQADLPARKVLYCQNHYYALFNSIAPERMAQLPFDAIACQSQIARNFLERVLHLKPVKIVPVSSTRISSGPDRNACRLHSYRANCRANPLPSTAYST